MDLLSPNVVAIIALVASAALATPDPPPGPGRVGGPGTPLKPHNSSCWDAKNQRWSYPTLGPKYHIASACFGENDPNAPFFYRGVYHVQFQEHVVGGIAGGHAVSTDLIKWRLLHPSVWPDTAYDQQDVYDFSVTVVDDVPVAIEAGLTPMGNGTPFCHVMSVPANLSDPWLRDWVKVKFNPLFCGEKGAGDTPSTAWQTSWGAWRYVDGYGNVYGTASNSTFRSKAWTRLCDKCFGKGICQDIYPLPRPCDACPALPPATPPRSPALLAGGAASECARPTHCKANTNNVECGCLDEGNATSAGKFTGGFGGGNIGWGNYYAQKSFYDPVKGRRIVYGWAVNDFKWPSVPGMRVKTDSQTLLREVTWDARMGPRGGVRCKPIDEVLQLRTATLANVSVPVALAAGGAQFIDVPLGGPPRSGNQSLVRVRFAPLPDAPTRIGVAVMTKAESDPVPNGTALGVRLYVDWPGTAHLNASAPYHVLSAASDRGPALGNHQFQHATWTMLASEAALEFDVFVDHTKIEWFLNDGAMAMSVNTPQALVSFMNNSKQGVGVFANGSATLAGAQVWRMASIWNNVTTHDRPEPL